jgi:hypothetical protein
MYLFCECRAGDKAYVCPILTLDASPRATLSLAVFKPWCVQSLSFTDHHPDLSRSIETHTTQTTPSSHRKVVCTRSSMRSRRSNKDLQQLGCVQKHILFFWHSRCDAQSCCMPWIRCRCYVFGTRTSQRSTGELASYQQKMFRIDNHIGIAIAGLTSDARVLRYVAAQLCNEICRMLNAMVRQ